MFWKIEQEFDETFCSTLIEIGTSLQTQTGEIEEETRINTDLRYSHISWINVPELSSVMFEYFRKANAHAGWNFDIRGIEPLQFSTYEPDMFYGWHTYTGLLFNSGTDETRKLSMSISLNEEYEGGDFEFSWGKPSKPYKKRIIPEPSLNKKGTILIFPSLLWHRIKPVIAGVRYSLVGWSIGPPFR